MIRCDVEDYAEGPVSAAALNASILSWQMTLMEAWSFSTDSAIAARSFALILRHGRSFSIGGSGKPAPWR